MGRERVGSGQAHIVLGSLFFSINARYFRLPLACADYPFVSGLSAESVLSDVGAFFQYCEK